MGIVSIPSFGADPVTITGPTLDSKVDGLATEFNGSIDNDNIKAAAAIANSKLNLANITQNVTLAGTNVLSGVTTLSGKIFKSAKGADVASTAGAITLGDDGNYFDITGTAAITSITAKTAGTVVVLQFDSTASLVDGSNLKLTGDFQGAAESQIMLISDGTNWFEVCRQPNNFTPTAANALTGSLLQVVYAEVGGTVSGSTAIPNDDTVPTWAEGDDTGVVCTITPKLSTSKLLVMVRGCIGGGTSQALRTFTLFKDPSGTDACIRSCPQLDGVAGGATPDLSLSYQMTSGVTTPISFKLRFGASTGTVYLNAYSTIEDLGGTAAASMTVYEIKA